jgi:hypothetical protein
MDKGLAITGPSQIVTSDRVKFSYHHRDWTGYVAKKGRTHATIVCDDTQEFRPQKTKDRGEGRKILVPRCLRYAPQSGKGSRWRKLGQEKRACRMWTSGGM